MNSTPYTPQRDTALQQAIDTALHSKGAGYTPRTRHLNDNGSPIYSNRLLLETSPYLLQHAHNPVDWYPWGEEALERARRENKPIFLSIGYSTCHWCHVMEYESFENVEIADYVNRHFIAIKVDREQRPDIDEIYMLAAQLISKRGGWPLSAFLTPGAKPFFAATYYPADQFSELLSRVSQLWLIQQDYLTSQAEQVINSINLLMQSSQQMQQVGISALKTAQQQLLEYHNEISGGFGNAPKFPREPLQFLLLRLAEKKPDTALLTALQSNLDAMLRGGIYDQIGGGFHRYATDTDWLVPHFEKMLYNQALLARIYLHAWRLTGKPEYRRVAQQTLDYVLRDLQSPEGGFYSATDADSEGKEGRFFIWKPAQIRKILNRVDANFIIQLYGMTENGNFEGANILHLPVSLQTFTKLYNYPLPQLLPRLDDLREQLYKVRETRIHPGLDSKIVTAWNSMMITTLAEAGDILAEQRYRNAAVKTANMLWQHCNNDSLELQRICRVAGSKIAATQEDYAYFAQALLALYDTEGKQHWLDKAVIVVEQMQLRFWDTESGGYFLSASDSGLPIRPKSSPDGTTPSGNSIAHEVLHKLFMRSGEQGYQHQAEAVLNTSSDSVLRQPLSHGYLLASLQQQLAGEFSTLGYAARGHIRAAARYHIDQNIIRIRLKTADGWHINSDKPLQSNLIPTQVKVTDRRFAESVVINYPQAEIRTLGFQQEPLALFAGHVDIEASISTEASLPFRLPLEISLQACNDEICLPPETLNLQVITGRTEKL
ncbi:MAG: DUF255 domain-containing protein [Amphritea sp.]